MRRLRSGALLLVVLGLFGMSLPALDLSLPTDYFKAYLATRADLEGGQSVFYYSGKVYGFVPGERRTELFDIEGFTIVRLEETEEGYRLLGKEAAFLKNPLTGEILSRWRNPYLNNRELPVIHIWNNPVNQSLFYSEEELRFIRRLLPSQILNDELVFYQDIFPFYDSPLPRSEYGHFSQSDTFQAAEFYQYSVRMECLEASDINNLPSRYSFTKVTPWLPFMSMADRPGSLMWVCRGYKLKGGFEELPEAVREFVMQHDPSFAFAPMEYSKPNTTSWSFFKKLQEAKPKPEDNLDF